jgi:hypothetical protein
VTGCVLEQLDLVQQLRCELWMLKSASLLLLKYHIDRLCIGPLDATFP